MQWNESDISVVRKVADEMWDSDGEVIFPPWDSGRPDEREVAIRTAALAVLNSVDPILASASGGRGVAVTEQALGALVRYIVDIMEP